MPSSPILFTGWPVTETPYHEGGFAWRLEAASAEDHGPVWRMVVEDMADPGASSYVECIGDFLLAHRVLAHFHLAFYHDPQANHWFVWEGKKNEYCLCEGTIYSRPLYKGGEWADADPYFIGEEDRYAFFNLLLDLPDPRDRKFWLESFEGVVWKSGGAA